MVVQSGKFVQSTPALVVQCRVESQHMTSREYICMNLPGQRKISLILHEKDVKPGRKDDSAIILTLLFQMRKNPVSQNNSELDEGRRRNEIDHGRFVHGIKNALAT